MRERSCQWTPEGEAGRRWSCRALTSLLSALFVLSALASPLMSSPAIAQDDTLAVAETETPPPTSGSIQITLYGSNGVPLTGAFAIVDAAGAYQQVWVVSGTGIASPVAAGTASITQVNSATDYSFTSSPAATTVPAGGVAAVQIVNPFLDADADGIGDSIDTCPAGNDLVDSDLDGVADACDLTPNGEDPAAVANLTESQSSDESNLIATPAADDASASGGLESNDAGALTVEVASEDVVITDAPVSCDAVAGDTPWVASDLADYPPGSIVTLTGGGWAPGQTVEIFVDDDGLADAEQGPWSHEAVVTADDLGRFVYQFSIAPWFVANYTVIATGECSEASTTFTDSVQGGNCVQVTASDIVSPGQYIMFRCATTQAPIRVGVTSITSGWQWSFIFSNDLNLTPPSYASLNWNSTGTASDSSASGNLAQAYFFLSPTASVLPGAFGTVHIDVKNPSGNTILYSSTLGGYRPVSTADFRIACTPTSSTVPVPGTQSVSCTLSAVSIATTATVNVSIPAIAVPSGWTASTPSPATGTVTQAIPFVFSFTMTSSCAASTNPQFAQIASNLTFVGSAVAGPSTSVSVARVSGTTASVGITSASLTWSRPYAFTAWPTNTGSLTYAVQATGCSGWNVTVSATTFTRSVGTAAIPASNFVLTDSTLPSGTGITAPVTSGSLNNSLKVLSASVNNGIGTFSQTLNVNLSIPAGTLVGSYQSIVTITVASGP